MMLFSARRPCERTSAKQMEMEMSDGLSAIRSRVRHETKTARVNPQRTRKCRDNLGQNMCCQLPILCTEVQHTRKMLLWNDENVFRSLRIKITKCEHGVVLIDLRRGNLPLCNLAKNTICHLIRFLSSYSTGIIR